MLYRLSYLPVAPRIMAGGFAFIYSAVLALPIDGEALEPVMDYVRYWGLNERPFENVRNARFFFESRAHAEALERMLYTVQDRNMAFGMLTGEIGSGKTLVWTTLLKRLPSSEYEAVALENGNLAFHDLLAEMLARMDRKNAPETREKYPLLRKFRSLLEERVAEGRHVVLVVDEAQELALPDLVELKNLSNMGSEEGSALTILLVGQPELREKVRALPQLDQRISLRYHLNPLAPRDVPGYLAHRLVTAGHPTGELFSGACAELLYASSGGIPRRINRICKLSLDMAYSRSLPEVEEGIVDAIVRDLRRQEGAL